MAYDTSLADRITDLLTALHLRFTTKAMMGGLCFEPKAKASKKRSSSVK